MERKNKIIFIAVCIAFVAFLATTVFSFVFSAGSARNVRAELDGLQSRFVRYDEQSNRLFAVTDDKKIAAFDNATGDLLFEKELAGRVSCFEIEDGKLYVAYEDAFVGDNGNHREIVVLDQDGVQQRMYEISYPVKSFAVSTERDCLVVATERQTLGENTIYYFDGLDSTSALTTRIPYKPYSVQINEESGEIALVAEDGNFMLGTAGTSLQFKKVSQVPHAPIGLYVLPGEGYCVPENSGSVYFFDFEGKVTSELKVCNTASASGFHPEVGLFIAEKGGRLYSVDTSAKKKGASISVFQETKDIEVLSNGGIALIEIVKYRHAFFDADTMGVKSFFFVFRFVALGLIAVAAGAVLFMAFNLNAALREKQKERLHRAKRVLKRHWKHYALILPSFILLAIFSYFPAIWGLLLSFFDYLPGVYNRFVGLDNFANLMQNELFWQGFGNMAIFLVTDLIKALVPSLIFAEAILALRSQRFQYVSRVLLYIPGILPGLAMLLIWTTGIYAENGLLNNFLSWFGINGTVWLTNDKTAIWAIIFMGFPFVGSYLLFYGALKSVPPSLREAAKMDGASYWRTILIIDIPLITPQIKYVFIISFIGSIQDFGRVYMTTQGQNNTNVPALQMYLQLMKGNNYGLAASMGMVLFILIFALTMLNMKMKTNEYV